MTRHAVPATQGIAALAMTAAPFVAAALTAATGSPRLARKVIRFGRVPTVRHLAARPAASHADRPPARLSAYAPVRLSAPADPLPGG